MNIQEKRKAIIEHIAKALIIAEPSGKNKTRYVSMLSAMNDKEFSMFMDDLKSGKDVLYYSTQNMTEDIINPRNMIKAADYLKVPLMQHLLITDKASGVRMKTPEQYLVVEAVVRRAQQYQDYKVSTPDHDRKIDMMSGQVTGGSRAANITGPEMLILVQRGLVNTALELVKVRGGDISAYNEFSRSCYETGEGSLQALSPNSRARSSMVAQMYLKGMMITSDFVA